MNYKIISMYIILLLAITINIIVNINQELELELARMEYKLYLNKQYTSNIVEAIEVNTCEPEKSTDETEWVDYTATAYCGCKACNGRWYGYPTASGTDYKEGRTIAVDSSIIPLGSKIEIEGMGIYTAEDTGSAIKGRIIDIYHDNHGRALDFGRQKVRIRRLD